MKYEKNKSKKLPKFRTLEELVEFFDTHDLGEYWDQMPETQLNIDLKKRRHIFTLEEDIAEKLTKIAKSKKVSSEALINLWLKEKITEKV